jgi:hypothetical protein
LHLARAIDVERRRLLCRSHLAREPAHLLQRMLITVTDEGPERRELQQLPHDQNEDDLLVIHGDVGPNLRQSPRIKRRECLVPDFVFRQRNWSACLHPGGMEISVAGGKESASGTTGILP